MQNHQQTFMSISILQLIIRWKKHLGIVFLASLVASIIISSPWVIKPEYKSTVVMFPTATNAVSRILLNNEGNGKEDILEFGQAEQSEQLLQILNSNEIRSKIIEKYNLFEHYGIDTASKYKYTKLFRKWDKNIHFDRTEYMAVEIVVYDTDAQMAADIANDIAALLDSTKNKIQRERALKAFKIVEKEYHALKNEVKTMEDSLTVLRKMGINDYETQAQVLNEQLAIAISKSNQAAINALEKKLKILGEYGGAYVSLRDALEHEKKQLSILKSKYEQAKVDATQDLPCKFIVNSAYKAEKKSYPIQWLIIVGITLASILLAIIIIIIIENYQSICNQLINK